MTIKPQRISPQNFSRFGEVAQVPHQDEPLASDEAFSYWSDIARYTINGETEIGYCTVFRREEQDVTWLERHEQTPELLIPIDGAFFLPVLVPGDSPEKAKVFEVRLGEGVVIGQGVWHGACQPAYDEEVTYFVIFRRGTPHEDVIKRDLEDTKIWS